MGIDPASIAQSVVTGIVTDKAKSAATAVIDRTTGREQIDPNADIQQQMLQALQGILQALSPEDNPNIDLPMAFQPYPYEYVSDMATYGKGHLSIFFHDATPIRADIAGVGTYQRTVGPGWVACDLWASTRFSTTDGLNHNVIVSYRTNTIGSAL